MKVDFEITVPGNVLSLQNEAVLNLPTVLEKAKVHKNVQNWLAGEEISHIKIKIFDCGGPSICYFINDKVGAAPQIFSGGTLKYNKINFWRKRG